MEEQGQKIADLERRVEILERHIGRLNSCITALAAMSNSPLGSMSCNFAIGADADGHPMPMTFADMARNPHPRSTTG